MNAQTDDDAAALAPLRRTSTSRPDRRGRSSSAWTRKRSSSRLAPVLGRRRLILE